MFRGKKSKERLRKVFDQVLAAFELSSDVDLESGGDDDKGKNISGVCLMARGESESDSEDNEIIPPKFIEEMIFVFTMKNKRREDD